MNLESGVDADRNRVRLAACRRPGRGEAAGGDDLLQLRVRNVLDVGPAVVEAVDHPLLTSNPRTIARMSQLDRERETDVSSPMIPNSTSRDSAFLMRSSATDIDAFSKVIIRRIPRPPRPPSPAAPRCSGYTGREITSAIAASVTGRLPGRYPSVRSRAVDAGQGGNTQHIRCRGASGARASSSRRKPAGVLVKNVLVGGIRRGRGDVGHGPEPLGVRGGLFPPGASTRPGTASWPAAPRPAPCPADCWSRLRRDGTAGRRHAAEPPQPTGQLVFLGEDHAAVSPPTEVLAGKNERVPTQPVSPAMRHSPSIFRRAPIACAASSITGIPRALATASTFSMAAICP